MITMMQQQHQQQPHRRDHHPSTTKTITAPRKHRIPLALQAIFIASNRGKEIKEAPPNSVGYSIFPRSWIRQLPTTADSEDSTVMNLSSDESMTGSPTSKSKVTRSDSLRSPQSYVEKICHSRGYSTEKFHAVRTAYYNKPTPLQLASYNFYLIDLVKKGDVDTFSSIVRSGISPTPCNAYSESLVHMVCRYGEARFLNILLENGGTLDIADDTGRTPLHAACWTGTADNFEVIEIILRVSRRLLFVVDKIGATPLSYVHKEHWPAWVDFLHKMKDEIWPQRRSHIVGEEGPPELALFGTNTRPMRDPHNALPPAMASMVASGSMDPAEARVVAIKHGHDDDSSTQEPSSFCFDSDDEYDDHDDSYEETEEGEETESKEEQDNVSVSSDATDVC